VVAAAQLEGGGPLSGQATALLFFGLFTACAVMCRSVLEEAVRQKLPAELERQVPLGIARGYAGQPAAEVTTTCC